MFKRLFPTTVFNVFGLCAAMIFLIWALAISTGFDQWPVHASFVGLMIGNVYFHASLYWRMCTTG